MSGVAASPLDLSLLPHLAWNLRWRDPVASEARLRQFTIHGDEENDEAHIIALNGLAWHARKNGAYDTAIATAKQAARRAAKVDDARGMACAKLTCAVAHIDRAEMEDCQENLARSMLHGSGSNGAQRIEHLLLRARLHWYAGEAQRAEEQVQVAIRNAKDEQLALAHHDQAWLCLWKRERDGLTTHLAEAADVISDFQMHGLVPLDLALRARVAREDGDADHALAYLAQAETLARAQGNRRALCVIQFERGASHALAGREEAGIADTRVALQLAEELGYRTLAPRIATQLGDLLTAAGEHECASAAFRKALSFKPV